MGTGRMMGLLEPRLRRFGLTKADQEDFAYALGEILADLERIVPILISGRTPSRDDVLELIANAVYHWPGHQKELAKLEKKLPLTASAMLSKARRKAMGLSEVSSIYRRERAKPRIRSKPA